MANMLDDKNPEFFISHIRPGLLIPSYSKPNDEIYEGLFLVANLISRFGKVLTAWPLEVKRLASNVLAGCYLPDTRD